MKPSPTTNRANLQKSSFGEEWPSANARRQNRPGFTKRLKGRGEKNILTLDLNTMDNPKNRNARFASIEAGKAVEDTRERLRALLAPLFGDHKPTRRTVYLGRPFRNVPLRRAAGGKIRTTLWTLMRHALGYAWNSALRNGRRNRLAASPRKSKRKPLASRRF